ncbi:MAG: DNA polymerase, partial [Myxococcota bacterium]
MTHAIFDLGSRLHHHEESSTRLPTISGERAGALYAALAELCALLRAGTQVALVSRPTPLPAHLRFQEERGSALLEALGIVEGFEAVRPADVVAFRRMMRELEMPALGEHLLRARSPGSGECLSEESGQLTFSFSPPKASPKPLALKPLLAPLHKTYETVRSAEQLDEVLRALSRADLFALDLETTSLVALDADIVGISIAWRADHGVYIPVAHQEPGGPQLELAYALERLAPVIEESTKRKVLQNAKYERHVLARHGMALGGVAFDTMLMGYILDPDRRSQGLDALAGEYLGASPLSFRDVTQTPRGRVRFDEVDVVSATEYAAEDADLTLALCKALRPRLKRDRLSRLHDALELPLVEVLWRMESVGVLVDPEKLEDLGEALDARLTSLQAQIDAWSPGVESVNVNSPAQLRRLLFEDLGLPEGKQKASGPSTDQYVLERLKGSHEAPGLVLEARELAKLKGTYIDGLREATREDTGRVHTSFNQTGTATGRLSSSRPNLQNIPMRKERGRSIRGAFAARPGAKLLAADYSQIELRVLAHLSGDEAMTGAFLRDEDIHARTAAEVLGIDPDELGPKERGVGKVINFGIIFGMGTRRLARSLKIEEEVARSYIQRYFERFSGVRELLDGYVLQAQETGVVHTMLGRIRLMDSLATERRRPGYAERVAMNAPVQGSAADLIKLAMLGIDRAIQAEDLPMSMILQVH